MSMKDPGYTRGCRLSDQSFPKYTRKCKNWIERAGHHNFSEIILIYLCQIWWKLPEIPDREKLEIVFHISLLKSPYLVSQRVRFSPKLSAQVSRDLINDGDISCQRHQQSCIDIGEGPS